jgi:hypothetical protein
VSDLHPLNPGITAQANPPFATERGTRNGSLNFVIPASEMRGQLTLHAELSRAPYASPTQPPFRSITVSVPLRQTLQVAGIMVGYDGPNAANTANITRAAPTKENLLATLGFSLAAYPVAAIPQLRIAGTITQKDPLNDAAGTTGCSPNWDALLAECVKAKNNDGDKPGWLYCGILNAGVPTSPVRGCGGDGVALFKVGAGQTAAHETGHALGLLPLSGGGLGHAPVPNAAGTLPSNADPNFPAYEPYDAANTARGRIGEYGLDVRNGNVMSPVISRDIMSPFNTPQMWVSLYTFGLLINNAGGTVWAVAIAPDGSWLATGGHDGTVTDLGSDHRHRGRVYTCVGTARPPRVERNETRCSRSVRAVHLQIQ